MLSKYKIGNSIESYQHLENYRTFDEIPIFIRSQGAFVVLYSEKKGKFILIPDHDQLNVLLIPLSLAFAPW